MEPLQNISNRFWIDQEKIDIETFLKDWENQQIENELSINCDNLSEVSLKLLNVEEGLIQKLDKECHLDQIMIPEDDDLAVYAYGNHFELTDDVQLKTVSLQKQHLDDCKNKLSYRCEAMRSLRNRNDKFLVHWQSNPSKISYLLPKINK
jgi:hypothetical protein